MMLLALSAAAHGQTDRQMLRRGNRHFSKKSYDKAGEYYNKAKALNPSNHKATFNLGCVAMSPHSPQSNDSVAIQRFVEAAEKHTDPTLKAQAFHNLGIIHQQHENYESAIDAYKHTLRLTPNNFIARYNLELCKRLLKKQQQQNPQNPQNQQRQQDNNNQDNNHNNDKDNNNDKPGQQKAPPKQDNNSRMSKDNARQMLNAAKQAERNTQQRLQKARRQKGGNSNRKNW